VGVALEGETFGGRLDLYAALTNGAPDGGMASADTDDGKEATVRVFAKPFPSGKDLSLGVAGTFGNARNRVPADYRTVGQETFFRWRKTDGTAGVEIHGTVHRVFLPPGPTAGRGRRRRGSSRGRRAPRR